MNVAIFTDNDFDKVNGVTTTLSAVLRCAPADMRLRIYTASSISVEAPDYHALRSIGVPIPFYQEMRMYVPHLREYVARARADRIDVIHLTTLGPVGLAALYVAWKLNLPMVGSVHTDLAAYTALLSGSPRLGSLMREYMRWPYGRCQRVLAPSYHTRELFIQAKGDPRKVDIWPRGVDTTLFSPEKRSERRRAEWHVAENRPALLYVGRVAREKGLDLLPALSRSLHASRFEHQVVIVGDGPLLTHLRSEMPDAVCTGVLSREAVAEAFASSDLFIFPSRTDTAGDVVLEAQASALPVIVSGDGGPRENMVSGVTGLVCHSEAPDRWASAIVDLFRDRSRHRAMVKASRDYALTRRWAEALQPLYRAYRDVRGAPVAAAPGDVLPQPVG